MPEALGRLYQLDQISLSQQSNLWWKPGFAQGGGENEKSGSRFLIGPPHGTRESKPTEVLTSSTGIQCSSCPLTSTGSRSPAGVWVKDQNAVGTQHILNQDNKLVPMFTWASEGNPVE